MYYCKIDDNGQIGFPQLLPNKYGNVIGGFDKLSNSKLIAYGFFPYIEPTFDSVLQEKKTLVYVSATKTVTHAIGDKELDIDDEKQKLITRSKAKANSLLAATDWYVIRKMERDIAIPEPVQQERAAIIARSNEIETEINALTVVRDVLTYQIEF